ncbi:MAG: methionine--tRNA ligase subunit beta [Candidatus Omnitrophota bacterium]
MVTFEEFKNIEIKTAKILEALDHPNANKLLLLKVEVGSEQKQIVAGIKERYSKEELIGKNIVIINNLEPVLLRGEKSEGMLLAAQDENTLSLIVPEKEVKSGSTVK